MVLVISIVNKRITLGIIQSHFLVYNLCWVLKHLVSCEHVQCTWLNECSTDPCTCGVCIKSTEANKTGNLKNQIVKGRIILYVL